MSCNSEHPTIYSQSDTFSRRTRILAEQMMNWSFIPGRNRRYFSSPQRPEWLWSSASNAFLGNATDTMFRTIKNLKIH